MLSVVLAPVILILVTALPFVDVVPNRWPPRVSRMRFGSESGVKPVPDGRFADASILGSLLDTNVMLSLYASKLPSPNRYCTQIVRSIDGSSEACNCHLKKRVGVMTRALLKSGEFEIRIAAVSRGALKVSLTEAVFVVSDPSLISTPIGSRVEKLIGAVETSPFSLCASTTMKYSWLMRRLLIVVQVV